MTGYGAGENEHFFVQIRSLNHRFLDISVRIHHRFLPLEELVRKSVQERIKRGRIFLQILCKRLPKAPLLLQEDVKDFLEEVRKKMEGVQVFVEFLSLLKEEEFFLPEEPRRWWRHLRPPLLEAINNLRSSREKEGRRLLVKIKEMVGRVKELVHEMEGLVKEEREHLRRRITEGVQQLALMPLDEGRLYTEFALIASRHDVTEEIERIKSHLEEFFTLCGQDECGKLMDFFIQELNRELSTIASKAATLKMKKLSLEAKMECERMREQVQNVE